MIVMTLLNAPDAGRNTYARFFPRLVSPLPVKVAPPDPPQAPPEASDCKAVCLIVSPVTCWLPGLPDYEGYDNSD